jgi:hypothetical protein
LFGCICNNTDETLAPVFSFVNNNIYAECCALKQRGHIDKNKDTAAKIDFSTTDLFK